MGRSPVRIGIAGGRETKKTCFASSIVRDIIKDNGQAIVLTSTYNYRPLTQVYEGVSQIVTPEKSNQAWDISPSQKNRLVLVQLEKAITLPQINYQLFDALIGVLVDLPRPVTLFVDDLWQMPSFFVSNLLTKYTGPIVFIGENIEDLANAHVSTDLLDGFYLFSGLMSDQEPHDFFGEDGARFYAKVKAKGDDYYAYGTGKGFSRLWEIQKVEDESQSEVVCPQEPYNWRVGTRN